MLIDRISETKEKVRDYDDLKSNITQNNKAVKNKNSFNKEIDNLMNLIILTSDYSKILGLSFNFEVINEIKDHLDELKNYILSQGIEEKEILKVKIEHKNLENMCKDVWSRYYNHNIGQLIRTLETVRKMNPIQIQQCIDELLKRKVWMDKKRDLLKCVENMEAAQTLIDCLGLDNEILSFLTKMNEGKATLLDLSSEVLAWIEKENLKNKIKIKM